MKKPAQRTRSNRAGGEHSIAFDLDGFLPYRLSIASNAVSRRIASAYSAQFDLTIPQWRILAVLAARGEASQQDLGRATLMDKVAVSRAALALEQRGLIVRRTDQSDTRARRLRLSPDGVQLFERIAPVARAQEQAILEALSDEETQLLRGLLERIERAARRAP
jgi:DNA-binding MarR family transcriptional regulator